MNQLRSAEHPFADWLKSEVQNASNQRSNSSSDCERACLAPQMLAWQMATSFLTQFSIAIQSASFSGPMKQGERRHRLHFHVSWVVHTMLWFCSWSHVSSSLISLIFLNNTSYWAVEGEEMTTLAVRRMKRCRMRTESFAWLFACRSCFHVHLCWWPLNYLPTGLVWLVEISCLPVRSSCHSNWDVNASKGHFR